MFSIIIPTLNEEKYLPILLGDLKNQTFQDFEVIHIDGESTDKTCELSAEFKKYIDISTYSVSKRSPSYQRNFGALKAKHEWLIFIDADIRIKNNFLDSVQTQLQNTTADFFTTTCKPNPNKPIYDMLLTFINVYTRLLSSSSKPFVTEGLLGCRRKTFEKLEGFDSNIKVNEGSELLERAAAIGAKLTMFPNVIYLMHMRRLEKKGVLPSMIDQAQIGLAHLLNFRLSNKKINDLYPMDDRFR